MKIKEKYQKENFEKIVKKSHTITEVICNLGLNPAGSNFKTIKKYIMSTLQQITRSDILINTRYVNRAYLFTYAENGRGGRT